MSTWPSLSGILKEMNFRRNIFLHPLFVTLSGVQRWGASSLGLSRRKRKDGPSYLSPPSPLDSAEFFLSCNTTYEEAYLKAAKEGAVVGVMQNLHVYLRGNFLRSGVAPPLIKFTRLLYA